MLSFFKLKSKMRHNWTNKFLMLLMIINRPKSYLEYHVINSSRCFSLGFPIEALDLSRNSDSHGKLIGRACTATGTDEGNGGDFVFFAFKSPCPGWPTWWFPFFWYNCGGWGEVRGESGWEVGGDLIGSFFTLAYNSSLCFSLFSCNSTRGSRIETG